MKYNAKYRRANMVRPGFMALHRLNLMHVRQTKAKAAKDVLAADKMSIKDKVHRLLWLSGRCQGYGDGRARATLRRHHEHKNINGTRILRLCRKLIKEAQ